LTFGGPTVKISDHWDSLPGKLKKKNFAIGTKFTFIPEKQGESFLLQIKGAKSFAMIKKWPASQNGILVFSKRTNLIAPFLSVRKFLPILKFARFCSLLLSLNIE
jgi:hypothetical protein